MHFSLVEKLGAAALLCAWLVYGAAFLGNTLVHVREHEPTIAVAGAPAAAPKEEAAASEAVEDIKPLLAQADPAAGEKVFGKCKSCHNAEKGGANQVGPNLWNVVGSPKTHHEGFAYSPALSGKGGEWTYEDLNAFLTSPKSYAPGTKMSFPGLSKPAERAAVIAYLRTRSDSPPPLP
jgi:cytochrome c